jgi:hypothetical protein
MPASVTETALKVTVTVELGPLMFTVPARLVTVDVAGAAGFVWVICKVKVVLNVPVPLPDHENFPRLIFEGVANVIAGLIPVKVRMALPEVKVGVLTGTHAAPKQP